MKSFIPVSHSTLLFSYWSPIIDSATETILECHFTIMYSPWLDYQTHLEFSQLFVFKKSVIFIYIPINQCINIKYTNYVQNNLRNQYLVKPPLAFNKVSTLRGILSMHRREIYFNIQLIPMQRYSLNESEPGCCFLLVFGS